MAFSNSRLRSSRTGGGWLGGLSPAPVGGRRSRRGGSVPLQPAAYGQKAGYRRSRRRRSRRR